VVPTLPPPPTQSTPSILIPVTGDDFSMKSPIKNWQKSTFNFGLGLIGLGMVLQGIRKRLEN